MMTYHPWLSLRHLVVSGDRGHELTVGHHAVFVIDGRVKLGSTFLAEGNGGYSPSGAQIECVGHSPAKLLCFSLQETRVCHGLEFERQLQVPAKTVVFRLDQVVFPLGARAYRHTHSGPGIRYLLRGTLDVESDHGSELMTSGKAWFEDANSPVQATASATSETAFVRASLLPIEYLGKPSISYLDEADFNKPRLQTNTRFFDQAIDL